MSTTKKQKTLQVVAFIFKSLAWVMHVSLLVISSILFEVMSEMHKSKRNNQ